MSGFYFPSVPKLKIRRGGVVDDIPPLPPVPSAASIPGVTVLQTPETMVSSSFFMSPTSAVTPEVLFYSFSVGPAPSSENSRQSGKRKVETDSREGAFRTPIPPPVERINIRFRRDELDPTVLGKLPVLAAIAAASVHKHWTSTFENATYNAELMELLKLAEMYTSRSHVLNCELYKVLAMKVDELHSTVGGMRMLTSCIQKTKIFENSSHSPKMRGLVSYMTLPKLRQSRGHVYRLRRRLNSS
ncbi:hypothetical protein Fot_04101 [Forsythia ovata]|uniref:Uncharacterized protein n=1 Tax=Forsythia ovata TaxID=205694 RepID=A0ABD1XBL7_9LAMI